MSKNRKSNKRKQVDVAEDISKLTQIAVKASAPSGEEKAKEEPRDEKPRDEEPRGEKPRDEEPRDEKPRDEEPRDEKPRDEKPRDDSSKEQGDSDEKVAQEAESKTEAPKPKEETPKPKQTTHTEALLQRYREIMALNVDVTRPANRVSQIAMQREFADHIIRECAANTSPLPRITTLINAMRNDKTFAYRFVTRHVFDENLVRRISRDYEITIHLLAMAAEHDVAHVIKHVDVDKSLSQIVNKSLRANLSAMFSN